VQRGSNYLPSSHQNGARDARTRRGVSRSEISKRIAVSISGQWLDGFAHNGKFSASDGAMNRTKEKVTRRFYLYAIRELFIGRIWRF
jgi:hypothetical protein